MVGGWYPIFYAWVNLSQFFCQHISKSVDNTRSSESNTNTLQEKDSFYQHKLVWPPVHSVKQYITLYNREKKKKIYNTWQHSFLLTSSFVAWFHLLHSEPIDVVAEFSQHERLAVIDAGNAARLPCVVHIKVIKRCLHGG